MSLFPELDGLSARELQATFLDDVQANKKGDETGLWFQEIAVLLVDSKEDESSDLDGITFLLACIQVADEVRLRAILIGLSSQNANHVERHRRKVAAAGVALLHDARPLVAMDAIDLLRSISDVDAHDEVLALYSHASPHVAGAVLRYLSQLFPVEAKPYLMEALTSNEPIVRQSAIDELDNLDCTTALPSLRSMLHDDDPFVRQAAQSAVRNLEELATVAE